MRWNDWLMLGSESLVAQTRAIGDSSREKKCAFSRFVLFGGRKCRSEINSLEVNATSTPRKASDRLRNFSVEHLCARFIDALASKKISEIQNVPPSRASCFASSFASPASL